MKIKREQLRRIMGDDPQAIKAFEDLFRQFGDSESNFETGSVDFIPSTQSRKTGRVWYDSNEGCLNVGMNGDEATLQVGMEEYYPLVKNNTGSTILNGTLVGFSGVGDYVEISPFIADGSIDPSYVVGFATEDIAYLSTGYCTKFGMLRNVNTTGASVGETWSKGDILYASPVFAGMLTNVKPTPPDISIPVASVIDVGTIGKLLVRVVPQQRLYFGVFFDTTNQTTLANTPTTVLFNSTHISSGVYIGTPTSRVYVDNAGLYEFDFSFQFVSSSAALQSIYIWFRVNGVDQSDSASKITIRDNNTTLVPSWKFSHEMHAGDYFELVWATSSANVSMEASPAQVVPFVMPAIPSIILNVAQLNQ